MKSASEYVESLRRRRVRVFARGVQIEDPVEHPLLAPSVRTVAESYAMAGEQPELFTAWSRFIEAPVNRFTHIFEAPEDLRRKQDLQRALGRRTGTCFQRCVGMDALNAVYNITFELDRAEGTDAHRRFVEYLRHVQREDLVVCGAMTDPKGDRAKRPAEQPDAFVRIVERRRGTIVVRGAKLHQTGVASSHEILVMPGRSLAEDESDFAVCFAVPVDAPGVTLVCGRTPSDDRRLGPALDQGNATYGPQEAVVLLEDVEVPLERVFLLGETRLAAPLVDTFAGHHRHSYGGCKPGNGDVLIGAAALAARLHGVERASHVRDKLVEMVHLNETLYACGVAAGACGQRTPAGTYAVDPLLANVCKQNVTRLPYELGRLAEDLAGGLMATLPAAEDFADAEVGPLLDRYLAGASGRTVDRVRVLRLIESMTIGTTCVPMRTEAMHGAGSPQAQRVRIGAQADLESKVADAARVAGIELPVRAR